MPYAMWTPYVFAIITYFFDIFFIEMIEKYLKKYNYIYNVCCFNEIHLEFSKVIFYKQWISLFVYINHCEALLLYPSCGGHLFFIIFMNISGLKKLPGSRNFIIGLVDPSQKRLVSTAY